MHVTVDLTDEQVAELDELSGIKHRSREELIAAAVADYLDEVRLPQFEIDEKRLSELMESLKHQERRIAVKQAC